MKKHGILEEKCALLEHGGEKKSHDRKRQPIESCDKATLNLAESMELSSKCLSLQNRQPSSKRLLPQRVDIVYDNSSSTITDDERESEENIGSIAYKRQKIAINVERTLGIPLPAGRPLPPAPLLQEIPKS